MRYSGVVARLKRYSAVFVLLSALLPAGSAAAVDSTVNVAVCGEGAAAQLTIDAPVSDSVVNQPNVTINGTVANASQIDVLIDGEYDATTPLSANQTSYDLSVQLTSGTHTIALTANDICHTQDATASVVITYQPQITPGTGGETPTNIDNGGGGVTIGDQPAPTNTGEKIDAENWPVLGPLVSLGRDLAVALDFEVTTQPGTLMQSVARFSFIVLGIGTFVFGNIALSAWGITHGALGFAPRWGLRAVGLVLVVIAFMI